MLDLELVLVGVQLHLLMQYVLIQGLDHVMNEDLMILDLLVEYLIKKKVSNLEVRVEVEV